VSLYKIFSPVNIKRMRQFYETWEHIFTNRPLATDEMQPVELHCFLSSGILER